MWRGILGTLYLAVGCHSTIRYLVFLRKSGMEEDPVRPVKPSVDKTASPRPRGSTSISTWWSHRSDPRTAT